MLAALAVAAAGTRDSAAALPPVLAGYDVVAYFSLDEDDSGVLGSEDYQANLTSTDMTNSTKKMEDTNYTFYFSSAENRETFLSDPWKYTPNWGAF